MQEEEIAKRYGLDLVKLKQEQSKLARNLTLNSNLNFDSVNTFAAIDTIIVLDKIIATIIICDKEYNILEEQYFMDKLRFPYLYEFRSYRELPAILEVFNKLQSKPDLVLIRAHGITHPRLGLASHLSLSINLPCIGVSDFIFEDLIIKEDNIYRMDKIVGKLLHTKESSNPIYISPGNLISVEDSFNICNKLIKSPHKLPEPIHLAHKYAKKIKEEIGV